MSLDPEIAGKWGIIMSIISAAFTSTGLCLQKIHLKKLKSTPDAPPSYTDTKYIAGISYVVIGLLLKGPISVMLPQVTIAIMSSQTVLYSTLLEFLFIKNQMDMVSLVCMGAIFIGLMIGVNGCTLADTNYSMGDMWSLLFSFHSITFVVVSIAIYLGLSELGKARLFEPNMSVRLFYTSIIAGLVAGLFGTFSKAFLEVVYYNTYFSSRKTVSYSVWILLIPAVLLGMLKMRTVSEALKEFPAYRFLPIYQAIAIIMNAVCGLVFLNEWDNIHRLHNGKMVLYYYVAGLILVSGGVGCFVLKHSDYQELSTAEEGQGLTEKRIPMASSDSDDEDNAEYEEYHISGGLNNLVPGGVNQYYGVMFGRSEEQSGILQDPNQPLSLAEKKAKSDYKAIFVGSMSNVGKSTTTGGYGSSGSNVSAAPNFHRYSDQAEL